MLLWQFESLAMVGGHISPSKTQKLVLIDPAFVVPLLESPDWRSFVQNLFHVELWNGLRELIAFAERFGPSKPLPETITEIKFSGINSRVSRRVFC